MTHFVSLDEIEWVNQYLALISIRINLSVLKINSRPKKCSMLNNKILSQKVSRSTIPAETNVPEWTSEYSDVFFLCWTQKRTGRIFFCVGPKNVQDAYNYHHTDCVQSHSPKPFLTSIVFEFAGLLAIVQSLVTPRIGFANFCCLGTRWNEFQGMHVHFWEWKKEICSFRWSIKRDII